MDEDLTIENKVAQSGLIDFDLEEYYPKGDRVLLDVADFLFEGLILKEKDFRDKIKSTDWTTYQDKFVAVTCTADAIVPTWAYMLMAASLEGNAKKVVFGNMETLETVLYNDALKQVDAEDYRDQRVIIKGCSKYPVPESAYVELTNLLKPVAKSIMYGEACSTVPIYKNTKK